MLSQLVEILQWQRKIEGAYYSKEQASRLFNEVDDILVKLENYNNYNRLYYQIMLFRKQKYKLRTPEELAELEGIIQHSILKSEDYALSKQAKIRFHEIYSNYYHLLQHKENEYNSNRQILSFFNEEYQKENPFDYFAHFSRYLALQQYTEPEKFEATLQTFKTLPEILNINTVEFSARVFAFSSRIEMTNTIRNRYFSKALELIPAQKAGIEKYSNSISEDVKMTAYYQFAYIYLVCNDLTNALIHINNIINEFREEIRSDIYLYARIVQAIIHYELKNYKVLPYLIRSISELLEKRKKLYKAEKIILVFLKNVAQIHNAKDWMIAITKVRDKFVKQIESDSFENRILDYFDFIAWLNSKIKKQSFYDVMSSEKMMK